MAAGGLSSFDASISHPASINYWSGIEGTVNGMLGGYPHVSRIDIRSSLTFLAKLRKASPSADSQDLLPRAVDCGAGIGRVTAGFLSRTCAIVDMVEPVPKFAAQARALAASELGPGRIGRVFESGLETWEPETQAYDLIWNQWCLGHLTDAELLAYLERCARAVRKGGWICVKENLSTNADGTDTFDELDSSITRSEKSWRRAFSEAGLVIVLEEVQKGFPKGLFPVKCFALRPVETR